jgi:hypothetical protein
MVVYDNLKPAVLQVLKGHQRREQDVFLHFHSVYRFEALFANVHAGWEKGSVENLVLCRHFCNSLYFTLLLPVHQGALVSQLKAARSV